MVKPFNPNIPITMHPTKMSKLSNIDPPAKIGDDHNFNTSTSSNPTLPVSKNAKRNKKRYERKKVAKQLEKTVASLSPEAMKEVFQFVADPNSKPSSKTGSRSSRSTSPDSSKEIKDEVACDLGLPAGAFEIRGFSKPFKPSIANAEFTFGGYEMPASTSPVFGASTVASSCSSSPMTSKRAKNSPSDEMKDPAEVEDVVMMDVEYPLIDEPVAVDTTQPLAFLQLPNSDGSDLRLVHDMHQGIQEQFYKKATEQILELGSTTHSLAFLQLPNSDGSDLRLIYEMHQNIQERFYKKATEILELGSMTQPLDFLRLPNSDGSDLRLVHDMHQNIQEQFYKKATEQVLELGSTTHSLAFLQLPNSDGSDLRLVHETHQDIQEQFYKKDTKQILGSDSAKEKKLSKSEKKMNWKEQKNITAHSDTVHTSFPNKESDVAKDNQQQAGNGGRDAELTTMDTATPFPAMDEHASDVAESDISANDAVQISSDEQITDATNQEQIFWEDSTMPSMLDTAIITSLRLNAMAEENLQQSGIGHDTTQEASDAHIFNQDTKADSSNKSPTERDSEVYDGHLESSLKKLLTFADFRQNSESSEATDDSLPNMIPGVESLEEFSSGLESTDGTLKIEKPNFQELLAYFSNSHCLEHDDHISPVPEFDKLVTEGGASSTEYPSDTLEAFPGSEYVPISLNTNTPAPVNVQAWATTVAQDATHATERPAATEECTTTTNTPSNKPDHHPEDFIVKANSTFIGSTSLADFVDELDCDISTGTTTRNDIKDAFVVLADLERQSLMDMTSAATYQALDPSSPVDVYRVRLGKISLPKFLQHVGFGFGSNGEVSIAKVIAAFTHCSVMDTRSRHKLKKLVAGGWTGCGSKW
ncbi:hypothetical protein P280DRAFT_506506 [Massarina eburnea CBS 473.64]|uniref:Uncharacterized protein n=1 Tax=Massarina eburnea CBS 473.64 TaxID=1395130 RepID=A0A6A6S3C4_9PLEO|nr:hypothetical protein P280DRAFT_506506 [Massarina eburnea CBS 473.64]